jgi:hypothetical protein
MANKNINIVNIDDSIGTKEIIEGFIQHDPFFKQYNVTYDFFFSSQEYYKKKKQTYNIIIYDWNLSQHSENTGKQLIDETKKDYIYKILYTGMVDQSGIIVEYAINNNILYIPKSGGKILIEELKKIINKL